MPEAPGRTQVEHPAELLADGVVGGLLDQLPDVGAAVRAEPDVRAQRRIVGHLDAVTREHPHPVRARAAVGDLRAVEPVPQVRVVAERLRRGSAAPAQRVGPGHRHRLVPPPRDGVAERILDDRRPHERRAPDPIGAVLRDADPRPVSVRPHLGPGLHLGLVGHGAPASRVSVRPKTLPSAPRAALTGRTVPCRDPSERGSMLAERMFDDDLNEDQRRAATHGDGPLLIVAGAGTGKTTTLAARVAHLLLERRRGPSGILLLTFSRPRVARDARRGPSGRAGTPMRRQGVGRHVPRGREPAAAAPRPRARPLARTSPCSTRPTPPT